uniref:Uncharacterized protein n=1 Tax=Anguilla anguilla TaxID=7936 RepID=A0A0E9RTN5_ANGAN
MQLLSTVHTRLIFHCHKPFMSLLQLSILHLHLSISLLPHFGKESVLKTDYNYVST